MNAICDFSGIVPKLVSFKIFSYLDLKSFLTCRQVCKNWEKLTSSAQLWKNLLPGLSTIKNPENSTVLKCFLQKNICLQSLDKYSAEANFLLDHKKCKFIYFSTLSEKAYSLSCEMSAFEGLNYNMKVKAKELIFDQKIALYDLEKETKNTKIIIFKQELNSEVVEIRQMYLVFSLPSMVASREKIIRIGQKVEFVITNLAKAALLGGIALTTHSLF